MTTCPDLEELKRYNRDACAHPRDKRVTGMGTRWDGARQVHVFCRACQADLGTPALVRAMDYEARKRDAEYATSYPTSKVTP